MISLTKENNPLSDGFMMPAEYDLHDGTLMIWPERSGSWGKDRIEAERAFCDIFAEIIKSEDLFLICPEKKAEAVITKILNNIHIEKDRIKVLDSEDIINSGKSEDVHKENLIYLIPMNTDDSWARDVGPTFVRNQKGEIRGIDWEFNAWGGTVDGLYLSWDKDDKVAGSFCKILQKNYYDAHPFVLEGGSIHSDGEGTVMVTETCLLSKGRNPLMSKTDIEEKLKLSLGAQKILWLPCGIYNDETNEHVDNICAFIAPGEVVLGWTDNREDPQYEMSLKALEYLEKVTDARGRHLRIHKLPIPDHPICITEKDLANYVFEEGEDEREVGERLAASYVNFYFTNTSVLVPAFGGENDESDKRACDILMRICPNRKVIPIYARPILLGGGNIHCITQQIPSEVSNMRRKVIAFE